MSRNLRYASIACASLTTTPRSFSTATWRPASVFSVGSVSGVPLGPLAKNEQEASRKAAPTRTLVPTHRATSSGLGRRTLALLGGVGTVVQLGEGEAGLRRVVGQALLLLRELGDGDVLHRALLLSRQRGHARDHHVQQGRERGDPLAERVEAHRLVLLRLGEIGIAPLQLSQFDVDALQFLLRVPDSRRLLLRELPGEYACGETNPV